LKSITYKDAGVDIEKGNAAINSIKDKIHSTYSKNVLTNLGSFGGMFEFSKNDFNEPVLVSSVDGVGTKLKIAFMTGKHDTVGEDLVNHCVNDIAVGGAKPLFFLDYFACGKLQVTVFEDVVSGFVRGCKNNNCALIGGETAEMPDMYQQDEYDVSGTIVGVVEKSQIINGSKIQKGNILVGVNSNGLHTNGYSLARKVLFSQYKVDSHVSELGAILGTELLRIHYSYLNLIESVKNKIQVNGISHITGGGIIGNTMRILPDGLKLKIYWNSWDILPVFDLIKKIGKVPDDDMRSSFNLGIGLIFVVDKKDENEVSQLIVNSNFKPYIIGEII